eukprot:633487-Pelagomonas_calceolata.AAC.1
MSKELTREKQINRLATYKALSFDHIVRKPIRLPRHLRLDLPQHVMLNVSQLRLRARTLNVETASWEDGVFSFHFDFKSFPIHAALKEWAL